MASQPLTGINQRPLVFAQIRQGSSSPEVIKARIVTSSRVVDIKSNMFLHLFYNKPYQRDQGYNHDVDQAYGFQVKSAPASSVYRNGDILAAGSNDVGDMKTLQISEREILTLSEDKTWEFKPSVRVADFFANSLGVPIDCWTPCSRIAIARELEASDLIKYELQCGAGESDACAMSAGELARSLHDGDQLSFGDVINGECVEDLQGHVQLSILFVNENPEIQPLDFRLRLRILPCQCPPVIVRHQKPVFDGQKFKGWILTYYKVKLVESENTLSGYRYILDKEITKKEAFCAGYGQHPNTWGDYWTFPPEGSTNQVSAISSTDALKGTEEGLNPLNFDKSYVLKGVMPMLPVLNICLGHIPKLGEQVGGPNGEFCLNLIHNDTANEFVNLQEPLLDATNYTGFWREGDKLGFVFKITEGDTSKCFFDALSHPAFYVYDREGPVNDRWQVIDQRTVSIGNFYGEKQRHLLTCDVTDRSEPIKWTFNWN